jgi:Flp pilus assembly protein CpaB
VQDAFSGKLQRSRGGALIIGVAAAVLAAILLAVYLHQYRSSVDSGSKPMTVLVAKSLIPKGTPGAVVAQRELFQVTQVRKDELKNLAISDPSVIRGRVAVADIYPNQQLTSSDFTEVQSNALPMQMARDQRAISIPLDASHGLIGQVQSGDRVDVYVGLGNGAGGGAVTKLLARNILVLSAANSTGNGTSGTTGNTVLRVSADQAAKFAFSSDYGKLWLVLRPRIEPSATPPALVTAQTLLAGTAR